MIAVCAVATCSKDKSETHKIERNRDNAAVVVVSAEEALSELTPESEPNNSEGDSTQSLQIRSATNADPKTSQGFRGTLDGYLDVDRFRITSAEEGLVFVTLAGASDADLRLELKDAAGKTLAYSDRGPAKTIEGVAGYWLDANRPYQLVVSEFTKKKARQAKTGRTGESQYYSLIAQMRVLEEGGELEPNETLDGAVELAIGVEQYGFYGWKDDLDFWRLPVNPAIEDSTSLAIELSGVPGVSARLSISDASGKDLMTVRSTKGNETAIRNFVPNPESEFVLVKVMAKRSNPKIPYSVTVRSQPHPQGRESEPNNDFSSATILPVSDGSLVLASGELAQGDVDIFGVEATSESRVLEVRLDGRAGLAFALTIASESGRNLAKAEEGAKGGAALVNNVHIPAGAKPLIRISAKNVAVPTSYSFSLSLVPGQATTPHASLLSEPVAPTINSIPLE